MVTMVDGDYPAEWYYAALSATIVGMDIETSGLDKWTDRIATVQMYVPGKGTIMARNLKHPDNILRILEAKETTKVFHYAGFDLGFLMKNYDVSPTRIADTKIAAKMIDPKKQRYFHPETLRGSHSLLALVWYHYKEKWDKSLAVSDWFVPELSQAQIEYAAKDVMYLPDMLLSIEAELRKLGLLRLTRNAYKHIPTRVELDLKRYDDVYSYA